MPEAWWLGALLLAGGLIYRDAPAGAAKIRAGRGSLVFCEDCAGCCGRYGFYGGDDFGLDGLGAVHWNVGPLYLLAGLAVAMRSRAGAVVAMGRLALAAGGDLSGGAFVLETLGICGSIAVF